MLSCAVDVMQSLVQTSREVLEKIYIACKGLSEKHQQTSHMFLSTYHEVFFPKSDPGKLTSQARIDAGYVRTYLAIFQILTGYCGDSDRG